MTTTATRPTMLQRFFPLAVLVAAMWLVEIADQVALDGGLDRHGILPRTISGIDGVLWAPVLHGGFGHLASNTVPLLVLGALVAMRGVRQWVMVTLFITVVGGLGTWVFARDAVHLGASLLIFGYISYLLVAGFRERSFVGIAVGVLVAVLYGGTLVSGILPTQSGVSWEGHLFGALAGAIAGLAATNRPARDTSPG